MQREMTREILAPLAAGLGSDLPELRGSLAASPGCGHGDGPIRHQGRATGVPAARGRGRRRRLHLQRYLTEPLPSDAAGSCR